MDLKGRLSDVVEYIETQLDGDIDYNVFSKMLCCSNREFSSIFTFIVGMSVSEYIRRRRLSKAALDIQSGKEKIIDIALKYGYESQAAFTRAFKEMHNQTPLSARQEGVLLKTYPKISFSLIIKGVIEMNFRIEKKDSFKIVGKVCSDDYANWVNFDNSHYPNLKAQGYVHAPFWYVRAYFLNREENQSCIIGVELKDANIPDGMEIETIPATTWAVFPFDFRLGEDAAGETYAKVMAEWIPTSTYARNENAPYMEVYGYDANTFEIWMPVVKA